MKKIKAGYYFFEDRYYSALDKIEKFVPIYKIIDPIDKVFPSFVLFLIIIAAIIIFLLWPIIASLAFGPGIFKAKILVQGEDKKAIDGAKIELSFLDKDLFEETDKNGFLIVEIPREDVNATISIEKTGFVSQKNIEITLSARTPAEITLKKPVPTSPTKYAINVIDAETRAPIESKVTAVFHCTGSGTPPQKMDTYTGELKDIKPSENCERLSADLSADSYENKSHAFTKEFDTVLMYKKTGSIEVTVTDPTGVVEGAELSLLKDGFDSVDSGITYSDGTYAFDRVSPGTYTVTATEGGRTEVSEEFEVEADETKSVEIKLSARIPIEEQKKIFVKVTDSDSKAPIAGARIMVFTGAIPIGQPEETDTDGLYSREVDKTKPYSMTISKQGYVTRIVSSVPLRNIDDENAVGIELAPMLQAPNQNYAEIMVHVFDEENTSVNEAKVFLYNKSAPGLIINFPHTPTDRDGNALFTALPAGDYNIRVTKDNIYTGEAETRAENGITSFVNIKLVLTEGNAKIRVTDKKTGLPLQNATIGFFNAENNASLGSCVTDAKGECESAKIKSDTRVFAKAIATGYLPGFSSLIIIRKGTQQETIRLVPENEYPADAKIIVEFDSLCSDTACKNIVTRIDSSATQQIRYARFNLVLPSNSEYKDIFQHFSVGPKEQATLPEVSGWKILILNVLNIPTYASIEFSKCYNPTDLYDSPANDCLTSTNAKQAVIKWDSLERGIIPVILKVKIEGALPEGTPIEFRSRVKAKVAGEDFESEELKRIFRIGEESCASPGFAWHFVLEDTLGNPMQIAQGIEKTRLSMGSEYNLDYSVTNCTAIDYRATLNAKNTRDAAGALPGDSLKMAISTSTGFGPIKIFDNINFPKNAEFASNNDPNLKIAILPQKTSASTHLFFELQTIPTNIDPSTKHALNFEIASQSTLELEMQSYLLIEPEMQAIGMVKDAQTGNPIEGALVKVLEPDETPIAGATAQTDVEGTFVINLTSEQLSDLAEIIVKAEKYGYAPIEKTINLLTDISFMPINLNYSCIKINSQSAIENGSPATIELQNIVPTDSFAQVEIKTVNCPGNVRVGFEPYIPPSSTLKNPIVFIAGQSTGTVEMANNETRKLIIGSIEGVQGEFPVLIKAQLLDIDSRMIAVGKILAKFSKASKDCFGIDTDKFVFDLTASNSDDGTMLNTCGIQTSSTAYPQAAMKTDGASVTVASPLSAPIAVDWTAQVGTASHSSNYTFEPSKGNVQEIMNIPTVLLTQFDPAIVGDTAKNPVYYRTTSSKPDQITVFLDGSNNTVKARLTQTVSRDNVDFTVRKRGAIQGKYALMEYTDFIDSAGATSKIAVNAKIEGYKLDGATLSKTTGGVGPYDIEADGKQHKISDFLNLADSHFYVISSATDKVEAFFKKGDVLSNVTTDTSSEIVAIAPDYKGMTKIMDLVFVVDTSRSMAPEWESLCQKIKDAKEILSTKYGFDVQTKIYPIALEAANLPSSWTANCSGIEIDAAGTQWDSTLSGEIQNPDPNIGGAGNGGYDHNAEAWAPAIQYMITNYVWRQNSNRVIVAVVDNDPTGKRCADYYENYNCDQQLRLSSDGNPSMQNEIGMMAKAVSSAAGTSPNAKLFFFYGFPLNHDSSLNDYPSGNSGLNDAFEIYSAAAKATSGLAESFGGDTAEGQRKSGERLAQMILGEMLSHSKQTFQLRLDTGLQGDCLLGTKVGYTGTDSELVPRVKMDWDWTQIGINACDTTNPEWIYCDQAQFYVSLLKKIHQISEWGKKEGDIAKNFLTVQGYMSFNAYLIEDTFTQKFKADLTNYYQGTFFNADSWFLPDSPERWDNYFVDAGKFKVLVKGLELTNTNNVKAEAGIYQITMRFNFSQGNWKFFIGQTPVATIEVNLKKISDPQYDNPFYHLPINGLVGIGATAQNSGRQNYGTQFELTNPEAADITIGEEVLIKDITKGELLVAASMAGNTSELNTSEVLSVNFNSSSYSPLELAFTPGNAMPIIGKATAKNSKAFLEYYLQSLGNAVTGTGPMNSWSLVASEIGDCKDFTGNEWSIAQDDDSIDEELTAIPNGNCRTGSYNSHGFAWSPVPPENESKSVYFGSVFYTPLQSSFTLRKSCDNDTVPSRFFRLTSTGSATDISGQDNSLDLSDSPFIIAQLADVFEKIKQGQVCVNISKETGSMQFWWNSMAIKNALIAEMPSISEELCG